MSSPLARLHRYAYKHPDARRVPDHLYYVAEREHKARTFAPNDQAHAGVVSDIANDLQKHFQEGVYLQHREVEKQIADYLESNLMYPKLVDKLRACRQTGTIGYVTLPDGSIAKRTAFDSKCSILRLCPDEAREEQRRLIERYKPIIENWCYRTGGQVQYCVLTWPNIPAGETIEVTERYNANPDKDGKPDWQEQKVTRSKLHYYKREMLAQLAKLRTRPEFNAIKGMLVGQEDPLAKDGKTWNLHLNLLLMVQGKFDWKAARAAWFEQTRHLFKKEVRKKNYKDFNVHFQRVNTKKLENSIIELIKYPAKHISKKQLLDNPDAQASADQAPPLTSWPAACFREWWEAGRAFRRTRSYGLLHSIDATRWQVLMTRNQRDDILLELSLDPRLTKTKWRKIDKQIREQLQPYLLPKIDSDSEDSSITWVGRFAFHPSSNRVAITSIGLIQGDNSGWKNHADSSISVNNAQGPP